MKKRCIKYILCLVLLILVIISNKSLAITSQGNYKIEDYKVNVMVNENNTLEIVEKITVFFNESLHRNL